MDSNLYGPTLSMMVYQSISPEVGSAICSLPESKQQELSNDLKDFPEWIITMDDIQKYQ